MRRMPWGRRPRRPSENVACKRDFPCGGAWPEADETSAPRRSPGFPRYFEVMRFPLPPAFSAERSGCRKLRIAISGERARVLAEASRLSKLGIAFQFCSRLLRCQRGTQKSVAAGRCNPNAGRMCSPEKKVSLTVLSFTCPAAERPLESVPNIPCRNDWHFAFLTQRIAVPKSVIDLPFCVSVY